MGSRQCGGTELPWEVVGLTYSTDRAFFDEVIVSAQSQLVHQRSVGAMSVTRCDDFWGNVEIGTAGWQWVDTHLH